MSTSAEIFSVGQPVAETIGRPGGGSVPFCILARRYSSAVLGVVITSLLKILVSNLPLVTNFRKVVIS